MRVVHPFDREILRLAVPTLAALVAEPLFLLVDTALVGHLGSVPLAGLGIASVVLQTAVGLLVFLAYATTPAVARLLGAGDRTAAVRAGVDGAWLALAVGAVLLLLGLFFAPATVAAFGSAPDVSTAAVSYLTISVFGLPAMLFVLAATGLLRGMQDTRTPLKIVTLGFTANAGLNAVFIYGLGWGIAGSALGTVIAQWGMAALFAVSVVRAARATGARLRPGFAGVTLAATSGGWLLLRTASLRLAMLATVFTASLTGVTGLATLQVALAVFSLLAFVLDSLAIAGQAMIGHGLGAARPDRVLLITRRLVRFGVLTGVLVGVVIAAVSPVLGRVFTSDEPVNRALMPVLVVMAVGVPLAGFVFVLDGVLIGAGDGRYLALSGMLNVAVYLPLLCWSGQQHSILAVWTAFGLGYIGVRALTLGLRVRGTRWLGPAPSLPDQQSRHTRSVGVTMKAIVYSETGAPSVLHLVDRPVPEPEAGEVRIRVVVSGVNPTDWKSRRGSKPGDPVGFAEIVPNQDGAGVVDAVGFGVHRFAVGDRVWTAIAAFASASGGTAQEFTVLPENRVYPLPDAASFDLGASLGVPALTAHRALTVAEDGPSRLSPGALAGKTVLVAGGAGAVGHATIQLARWAGAAVITTISSPMKAALARAAGAHHVVNYRETDAAFEIRRLAPDGVDLIVEVAPDKNAELDAKVIRNRGSIAVYASTGDPLVLDIRVLMTLNVRYQFQLLYTQGQDVRDAAAADINAAIIDGALPIGDDVGLPLHRFSLAETAEAHAAVEGDIVGKVLIDVGHTGEV